MATSTVSAKPVSKEARPQVAQNIIEKIWQAHIVQQLEGHPAVFAVDLMLLHEVTSAQAFQTLRDKKIPVFDPSRLLATIDHSIPTRENRLEIYDDLARQQVETLRNNCVDNGIPFLDFDKGQGIVHVVGPELGLTQPGMTIVCGDSHTSTHGAFGALAFGIGTSEVAQVLATGCLLQERPGTMKVEFQGRLAPGVFAKDVIMRLIAEIGVGGANGFVIEYTGESIAAMSMEERMTVCNMSIECGARAGLISPDTTTFDYLRNRKCAPANFEEAVAVWRTFSSDEGCSYDRNIVIDLSQLSPMITWGTNPGQAVPLSQPIPEMHAYTSDKDRLLAKRALEYVDLKAGQTLIDTPIDWAFLGSCTNGRIEDLRVAANLLKGKRVHHRVKMYVVPGSESVRKQALEEGLDKIFAEAGAQFRQPGCSMCLAMNDDRVGPRERCISSSNRNFVGRQGPDSITHLASPATVAASAIEGKITSPLKYFSYGGQRQ